MSQAKPKDENPEQRINKKVDLVCYINREDGETRRQFADRVDESRDYFERDTTVTEDHTYKIVSDGESHEITEEFFNTLKNKDLGEVELEHEIETYENTDFVRDPEKPLRNMLDEMVYDIKPENGGYPFDWENYWFGNKIKTEDGSSVFGYTTSFTRMPMLKHQSEISQEDMYEDEDEEHLAFKIKIQYRDVTEDQLEWLDENIVGETMTRLGRHEWIDRVRTFDCEMEKKEKGVCWNI